MIQGDGPREQIMSNQFTVIRQSLLEWYDTKPNSRVLIVNEPEGFLADLFTKKNASVTSINDMDALRADTNSYDLVIAYDIYGLCLDFDTTVLDMVNVLLLHKSNSGTLFLAMENKLGLKYFAGCAEEQRGDYYAGIEDYAGWPEDTSPLSKHELTQMLQGIDGINYRFYYPYPDYKYPTMIFSDDCLPTPGELVRNTRNIDRDRLVMFDERAGFDSIIKAGLFPDLSNSFLIEIS